MFPQKVWDYMSRPAACNNLYLPNLFSQSNARLVCPICPYQDTAYRRMELKHYLSHIREVHSYLPGFSITCGMYGCPRTFRNFLTFRSHIYDLHGGDSGITNQPVHPATQHSACEPVSGSEATTTSVANPSQYEIGGEGSAEMDSMEGDQSKGMNGHFPTVTNVIMTKHPNYISLQSCVYFQDVVMMMILVMDWINRRLYLSWG